MEMVIVGMCGEAQGISGSLGLINEPQVNLSLGDSQVLREWVEAAKFVFFLDCQDKSSLRINVQEFGYLPDTDQDFVSLMKYWNTCKHRSRI